jgi:hypothetical protein
MTDKVEATENNVLFLDISSTCTGFAIGKMDFRKHTATISRAGVIWFGNDWDHGRKYNYLSSFILNQAYPLHDVFEIVAEAYMVNKKRMMGTLVIPEATGAVKAACYETEPPLGFDTIFPQSWRSTLGIKKNKKFAGTKAWKEPAKKYVESVFPDKIPEKLTSNVTGKLRPTPYDLYDVLCIAMAWFKKHGVEEFTLEAEFK